MHPKLSKDKIPRCEEVIAELNRCHKENPSGKFFGACNEAKWALDKCLRNNKNIIAHERVAEARKKRAEFEEAKVKMNAAGVKL